MLVCIEIWIEFLLSPHSHPSREKHLMSTSNPLFKNNLHYSCTDLVLSPEVELLGVISFWFLRS
jgi:hypothetical protein